MRFMVMVKVSEGSENEVVMPSDQFMAYLNNSTTSSWKPEF